MSSQAGEDPGEQICGSLEFNEKLQKNKQPLSFAYYQTLNLSENYLLDKNVFQEQKRKKKKTSVRQTLGKFFNNKHCDSKVSR